MPQRKKPSRNTRHGKALQASKGKSKDLLDLEEDSINYSASSIQSKLLFCEKGDSLWPPLTKPENVRIPDKKPNISAVPESNVLGKVKDFLGVISEANERLQLDSTENSTKYDIEVLEGDESEYIEMDLMLGVADLHTPEAVAAAESAMADGYQPSVSLAAGSSSDDDDIVDDDSDGKHDEEKLSKASSGNGNSSSKASRNNRSKKQPKIVELS